MPKIDFTSEAFPKFRLHPYTPLVCKWMDRNKRWESWKVRHCFEFPSRTQDTPREFVERDTEYLHRNWPINAVKGCEITNLIKYLIPQTFNSDKQILIFSQQFHYPFPPSIDSKFNNPRVSINARFRKRTPPNTSPRDLGTWLTRICSTEETTC